MHLKILCAATSALALAACASAGAPGPGGGGPGAATSPPAAAASPLLLGGTTLDLTFNQLGKALVANWGSLTSAQRAKAKTLSGELYAIVAAADAAETLGDAATVAAKTSAAVKIVGEIDQLRPTSAQVAAPVGGTGG